MKTWVNASIEEISFTATEQGGQVSSTYDHAWLDDNKAMHVTFES